MDQLISELRAQVRGDVRFDPVSRALYATDASIYQIEPLGVVLPRDEQDVAAVLRLARRHSVAVLPRGGATSLAGQTVGRAIQLDFTRYMHRLLEVNAAEGWAWVEPGLVLDELNALLAPYDLKFAPDVSPGNRATIGGMIGNNSSGMYSLVYGKTIDHVLELKVMLADGSVTTLGPLDEDGLRAKLVLDSLEGRAYRTVRRLGRELAGEIEQRFPKVLRRVGGYNLDAFVLASPENQEPRTENHLNRSGSQFSVLGSKGQQQFNLSNLIVGSEGTLAVILAAKIRLVPRPKHTAIDVVHFDALDDALDAVLPCLACGPAAVELMDDILLDLTRDSREYARHLASFLQGRPRAVLQVEFFGETQAEVIARLDQLERHLREHTRAVAFTRALTASEKSPILQVRKASMPLLQSMSPDRKPETFVEDSAVAPEKLGDYIRQFRAIVHAHDVQVSFYGHASVGLMHARPLINLKDPADIAKMRSIAEQIKDLSIEFGGALSGEHGDGLARSEFNRELFGEKLYEAFREVKRTFDPHGVLNSGKIVDAPPMDANLRYGADYRVTLPLETHFRFRDSGGIAGAAELCNGNGLCRKTASGTMCPSYMVTRDEQHSTRGRANALRMVLSGALAPAELASERMREVMDLCIECKGCTAECPSRVNMTRLKAEWLSHYHAANGVPLRSRLFGHIRLVNQIGSALAPLSNWALGLPGLSPLNERLLGISRQRRLPYFAREPFDRWFWRRESGVGSWGLADPLLTPNPQLPTPTVVLFPDTFTNYNDPGIGRAAVRVLEAAGYEVLLPRRPICCGRPMISKGLLAEAKALAHQQMEWLAPYAQAGLPIVGLEPSCILTFRDEYPDLLDDPRNPDVGRGAEALARQSFLIDEFLVREAGGLRLGPWKSSLRVNDQQSSGPQASSPQPQVSFLLHGHCHQKALVGTAHALALLRMIPGVEAREVDSGCCGMAGSFGYEAEHYAISQAIGERALFPAVRALAPESQVVAMGTSCRQQIADGTGRRARHLVEVLADALA
ncbi:MAG TPA: FAD-linked oxidase C-terminal domain-containing protein [Roseiflexaceae bacterium]|nr:FAD-linked oxidase C-terminal domain-containing protein [Roseiflexaceae bacterium]